MGKNDKEADVLKRIKLTLSLYCPHIIYVDRLQSGAIPHGKGIIRMCKKGTPDLFAIMKYKGGKIIFIECKHPKTGRQTPEQKEFQNMLEGASNIHYVLARSVGDVIKYIENNIIDK